MVRPRFPYAEAKSSLKRTSTTGQGSSQCLSVMVTTTVCPLMRYSPLTNSCEKRPDPSSPASVAPFSLAALPLEAVMNSNRNGLGSRKTEGCARPSQPENPHSSAVFTQVHNAL